MSEFHKDWTRAGVQDIVVNGELVRGAAYGQVMVESSSDLADLTGYPAGTIAYTAGFGSIWQLGTDGEWASV